MDVVRSKTSAATAPDLGVEGVTPATSPPAVAPNSSLPGTILSIQVLRFVAALSVVVFHAHNTLVDRISRHQPDSIDHAFRVGASGVHIFFVISGFVMVYTSWRSRLTAGAFLSRRLIRIYPIYWIMAATYLVVHLFLGTAYNLSGSAVAASALLLPHFSSVIIGPGWTLSFEMYFYLCFALALRAGLERGLVLLSLFYAICVVTGLSVGPHSPFLRFASDSLLLEFIAGAWLGLAFANGFVTGRRTGGLLIGIAAALFVSGFWFDYERLPSVISWGIPSLLLVTGALSFEPQLRSSGGRAFAKMGDSSYLLYLSHVLLLDILIATPIGFLNRDVASAVWLSLTLTAVCTIAAAFGYELIELPLLKTMKKWLLPRRNRSARPSVPAV